MGQYVQLLAQHARFHERFVLRGDDDRWLVWFGETAIAEPQEIAAATAGWLLKQT